MKNHTARSTDIRLAAPQAPSVPLADRGRMLFVPDVIELLQGKKGVWWVRNRFAPEYKHKLGRDPYWWEREALAWLDAQEAA